MQVDLTDAAREQESNFSDDEPSSSHSRSSSPDPLDSISRGSSNDPPSPPPPARTRRPPVRPNRDAYSSQSSPFTWSATIDGQRRPLWRDRDKETDDRASQRVISMFSGNVGALNRRRTLRKGGHERIRRRIKVLTMDGQLMIG